MTLEVARNPPASEIVTWKTYVPAAEKVAVVFLAALELLAPSVGSAAPAGLLITCQLYVRFDSPRLYPPSTDRLVVFEERGLGVAVAGVTTVGFWCRRSQSCFW